MPLPLASETRHRSTPIARCPACSTRGRTIVTASTDVFVNKKGAAGRTTGNPRRVLRANNFTVVKGSPTVYVNGKPFARNERQDQHCGGSGAIIEGSPKCSSTTPDAAGLPVPDRPLEISPRAGRSRRRSAEEGSDTDQGGEDDSQEGRQQTSRTSASRLHRLGLELQRPANGRTSAAIECKDPEGQLQIEIGRKAPIARRQEVKSESAAPRRA